MPPALPVVPDYPLATGCGDTLNGLPRRTVDDRTEPPRACLRLVLLLGVPIRARGLCHGCFGIMATRCA